MSNRRPFVGGNWKMNGDLASSETLAAELRRSLGSHHGAEAVVFDIDGTLTTSDAELVDGIVLHTVGSSAEMLFELAGSPLSKSQWLWVLDRLLDD